MDRSHIYTISTGAVTLAVAAPVIVSIVGLISLLWPVIPLLAVGSVLVTANNKTNNNKNHDNDNTKKGNKTDSANRDCA